STSRVPADRLGLLWLPCTGERSWKADYGHCYQINPGTIAGVVLGDLFLTLLIALGVYYVVSCIYKQQATSSGKEERFPHPQSYIRQGRRNGVFQTRQL
uniref:TYRO protein tyrosine kinase-binding protein n=1 Tax=Pseudonaja textilis TaxID=8673 RepID=A0A670YV33_PSETE